MTFPDLDFERIKPRAMSWQDRINRPDIMAAMKEEENMRNPTRISFKPKSKPSLPSASEIVIGQTCELQHDDAGPGSVAIKLDDVTNMLHTLANQASRSQVFLVIHEDSDKPPEIVCVTSGTGCKLMSAEIEEKRYP